MPASLHSEYLGFNYRVRSERDLLECHGNDNLLHSLSTASTDSVQLDPAH